MQYLHKNPSESPKSFDIGWKGVVFGIVAVALSLILSIAAVDLVASVLL